MALSKKFSYILIALIFLVTSSLFNIVFEVTNFFVYALIAILSSLGGVYLLRMAHRGVYLLDKLLYMLIFLLSGYFFAFSFPNLSEYLMFAFLLGFTGLIYALLLSFNIYLVAEKYNESMPLIQPARLIIFICTILCSFLFATVTYKIRLFNDYPLVNLFLKSILFFGFYYLIFYTIRWFFLDEKIGELKEKNVIKIESVSFFAVLGITQLAIILMYFPYESYAAAIVLSVTAYVLLNLIQKLLVHKVNLRYIIESAILILLSLFIAYFIS